MDRPFLFLGHGEGSGTVDLLVALADPAGDASSLEAALDAWSEPGRDPLVQREGAIVDVMVALKKGPKLLPSLVKALEAVHAKTPLALVVRTNRVKPSAWHAESVASPARLLDLLEAHVQARRGETYTMLPVDLSGGDSVHRSAWENVKYHSKLAGLLQATLHAVSEAVKKDKRARAVWEDLVTSRLPAWLGLDFGVDLVVQEALSKALAVSPTSLELPGHFLDAFDKMVRASHEDAQWHSDDDEGAQAFDWLKPEAIRAALTSDDTDWAALQRSFRDTKESYADALLALTHEERVALAKRRQFSTLLLNCGTMLMTAGRAADAVTMMSAGIEGPFDARAAANPLFAVQDDNTHLGVDVARHRRFLERCLPHGAQNPTVFLNGACVAMELDEADEALRLLALAKQHKVDVKPFKNERLFAPLRERKEFKALMK